MRHEASGFRQNELSGGPRESTQILGGHLVSHVTQEGVEELDERARVLGGEACSRPVLAVGENSGAELTAQTGLDELHQRLTREGEGRRRTGQQPTDRLDQLETKG